MTQTGKLLVVFWALILTFLVAHDVCEQWTRSAIIVRPLETTKDLEDEGLSGRTLAEMLAENLKEIRDTARSTVRPGALAAPVLEGKSDLGVSLLQEAKLPGIGIPTDLLRDAILEAMGKPAIKISGGLSRSPATIVLTIRISNQPAVVLKRPGKDCGLDCIEDLVREASGRIYQSLDPYAFAVYLYTSGDRARCEEAIRYCLTHKPIEDDAAAYNLWGLVLRAQGDGDEAERKFTRALERLGDKKSAPQLAATIYSNLGILLSSQDKLPDARSMYEKALAIKADNAAALFNCGLAWHKEKNYAMAVEH